MNKQIKKIKNLVAPTTSHIVRGQLWMLEGTSQWFEVASTGYLIHTDSLYFSHEVIDGDVMYYQWQVENTNRFVTDVTEVWYERWL